MATKTGTKTIADLLAARFQSAAAFGLNTIAEVLQADLDAHNFIVSQLMGDMAAPSSDRQRISGSSINGTFVKVDEFGRGPTQKELPGATVGFPLEKFQMPIGWTRDFMQEATPADLAEMQLAVEKAHLVAIRLEIQRAIYRSANFSFVDAFVDSITLAVKRLVNADSAPIPDGPNGEVFDGATHTHYTAEASLTAANLTASIDTVVEHGHGSDVVMAISRTDEAAVRALTGFVGYVDPRVTLNSNANEALRRADIARLDNRAIGIFGAAEVWVKPWAIANYAVTWASTGGMPPLVFREKPQGGLQGLRLAAQLDTHPMIAEYYEALFGVGVWNRTNGAVHYFGGASYTDPAL